jgi:NTE family protein
MKRMLVLGGGGIVGVAWESGLVQGLADAGVDVFGFDAIVGTSAGAIVGAQIAAGHIPSLSDPRTAGPNPLLDPTRVDAQAVGGVFTLWAALDVTTPEKAAEIGRIARTVHRDAEADWVEYLAKDLPLNDWPQRRVCVVAVDTATGQRRVFEREHGVPIERVLAASAAIPGLMPSVSIDGHLYMDGQVHSSTNADVLIGEHPREVWIAMPTNTVTGRGIGPHAERMLALEVEELRKAGCQVHVRMPRPEDQPRIGTNLMDPRRAVAAYAVGREAGEQFAREIG